MSSTEDRNPNSYDLDLKNSREILEIINQEDQQIAIKVNEAMDQIEPLVNEVIKTFNKGGRLFYLGAGTSGRLGVLDASETVPTFSVEPKMVTGLIAGGDDALRNPIENAEDSADAARIDLEKEGLKENDFVIGIAASGRTPYSIGAIEYARKIGAKTGSIACNKDAKISSYADFPIEIKTGAEVLSGSTRMKAGTATKLVLNMISTMTMIGVGKVYDNLMVDLRPTNQKLIHRSIRIIQDVCDLNHQEAIELYEKSDHNIKIAIVMHLCSTTQQDARLRLKQNNGVIKQAINT